MSSAGRAVWETAQVPGVRRRLRDVQKKVSGVLAGPRDESAPEVAEPAEEPAEAVTDPADAPVPVTEPVAEAVSPPPEQSTAAEPEAPVLLDEVCAAAVEQARAAAVEVAGPAVGAHLGVEAEDERVVTHSFSTAEPGYVGWRWAVTVVRAQDSAVVTVDEVVLLPGSGALLAPAWVPWSERVQPGDLNPGDLLPPDQDDPRLVPSYADVDAPTLPFDLHRELGLGRPRVLSAEGRAEASERWYDGEAGPDTPMAKAAPGRCGDCGFLVLLAGSLGSVFGACANAMSPDDGRVVAVTHGCGAHSETVVEATESSYAGMAVEDDEFEVVDRARIPAPVEDVPGEEVLPGSDAVGVELDEDSAAVVEAVVEGVVEAQPEGDDVVEVDGLLVPRDAVEDDDTGPDAP